MRQPPDWVLYTAAVSGLAVLAIAKQERADAPAAPPPISQSAELGLSPGLRAAPQRSLEPKAAARTWGTAFSVSEAGVWLTARHVMAGCERAAVLVSSRRGVEARVTPDRGGDIAVLATEGGAPALPFASPAMVAPGERAWLPGYPRRAPGEVAVRLLGPYRLQRLGHTERDQPALAWAEVGRTDGLKGSLAGLSGAPVLDGAGRVVGVVLAQSPRRGRLYSTTPEAMARALAVAGLRPADFALGTKVGVGNYGRVADALRRDLRVAPVACLD